MSEDQKPIVRHRKSVSETYHLGAVGDCMWANITINSIGDLNIQSDYGNYNYGWRSFGENFKAFLIRICSKAATEGSYLYDKLHNSDKARMVDVKKSITVWKKELLLMRRQTGNLYKRYPRVKISDDVTEDQAREAWDELWQFEREAGSECSQDAFYMRLDRPALDIFDWEWRIHGDGSPETTGDRSCMALCRKVMPAFAEILRKELEEETVSAAS